MLVSQNPCAGLDVAATAETRSRKGRLVYETRRATADVHVIDAQAVA